MTTSNDLIKNLRDKYTFSEGIDASNVLEREAEFDKIMDAYTAKVRAEAIREVADDLTEVSHIAPRRNKFSKGHASGWTSAASLARQRASWAERYSKRVLSRGTI